MAGERCTEAEAELRTSAVAGMLLEGLSRSEIMAKCEDLGWGLSQSQLDRYIQRGREDASEVAAAELRQHVPVFEARFERLYGMAIDNQDVGQALKVLEKQATVLGFVRKSASDDEERRMRDWC